MRLTVLTAAFLWAGAATATTSEVAIPRDPDAPVGRLSRAVVPNAYRLDFDLDPSRARFFGHNEIDVTIAADTRKIYLHGRDLQVTSASAKVGRTIVRARYTQVDRTGVVRLDFDRPLPAGSATLRFDYSGAFGDSASGMFRVKVAGKWYSWTQFESTDARSAFPSFDEPGFKTPFTISVTARKGDVVVSNAREKVARPVSVKSRPAVMRLPSDGSTESGAAVLHQFEETKPLPTYLVAIDTGPFVHLEGTVPATSQRPAPLPLGGVATQAQRDKMAFVMSETPRIVGLLEQYFGEPFPFPKLDQIGTPIMPGAMENAGADTYADSIIFLDRGAPTDQKQVFGMVVSHELAHQWFGDLVTPVWWDDIWLNESFANWMGYRIGNEWRPELKLGLGALDESFAAMSIDGLLAGRPIHQKIAETEEIDSAFDNITYGKGGQVVAMIAAYLGDEKFKQGVRLHLQRHRYGNATSDQFFEAIADAGKDPQLVAAFRSFVDQPGVPVVDIKRSNGRLIATQSRYAYLGTKAPAQLWTIPLCLRVATASHCQLLGSASAPLALQDKGGPIMPNVGGTGYYRFNLDPADWSALIASAPQLPAGEALATTDSLWAAFRAGHVPARFLVDEARAMAGNPSAAASVDAGQRLAGLRARGLIASTSLPVYRALIASIYGPRLAELGFDPAAGANAGDDPDRQQLRQQLVQLMAFQAEDPAVRARLKSAATVYLGARPQKLNPAFLAAALEVLAQDGGLATSKSLVDRALASEDPNFRGAALDAAASSGSPDVARYLLALDDPRLRPFDRLQLILTLAATEQTRDFTGDWVIDNYAKLARGTNGIFITTRLPGALRTQCGTAQADRMDRILGPAIREAKSALLPFERTLEQVRDCGILKDAKGAELAAALQG